MKAQGPLAHNAAEAGDDDARREPRNRRSSLLNTAKDPVRRLLDEGDDHLTAGRGGEASLAFERVLLHDPGHAEARIGLERARAAVTEAERRSESSVDDAERAIDRGAWDEARAHVDAALAERPSGARALALADRLDRRSGRVAAPVVRRETPPAPLHADHRPHWSRRVFLATCALLFASLAAGVAASWDGLIGRLTRAPRPAAMTAPPTLGAAAQSEGGRAVSDARRYLEQGDPAGALEALERVRPEDPLYPYAQQLRLQSEAARRGADAR